MGLSFRGFFLGIIAAAAVALIVSFTEISVKYIQIGFLQLPPVVVGLLTFALIANSWLKKLSKKLALSAQELMTVYCMGVFSAMTSSRGLLEKIIPLLVTPAYYANDSNNWDKLYWPNIKQWLVPFNVKGSRNQLVADAFFEGLRTGDKIPWELWIGPLIWWSLLAFFVFGAFLCMAAILRKQWADNEKLSFPLAQLPLEMIREEKGFFSNKLACAGYAIPIAVFMLNGLHQWFPSVPYAPLEIQLNQHYINPPFSYLGYTPIYISFAAIGFFFMLPSEILFSCWSFLWI